MLLLHGAVGELGSQLESNNERSMDPTAQPAEKRRKLSLSLKRVSSREDTINVVPHNIDINDKINIPAAASPALAAPPTVGRNTYSAADWSRGKIPASFGSIAATANGFGGVAVLGRRESGVNVANVPSSIESASERYANINDKAGPVPILNDKTGPVPTPIPSIQH